MYVRDRLIPIATELEKERDVTAELLSKEPLMISSHRDDEIGSFNQFATHLTLDVSRGIRAFQS